MGAQPILGSSWTKFFLLYLIFSLFPILVTPAFSTHTASVTVSPQYVQGGVTETYTFTVTNNGDDPIYYIKITAPEGFTITGNVVCPEDVSDTYDWTSSYTQDYVICQTSGNPANENLISTSESATIKFTATSSNPQQDTVYSWEVYTEDNQWGSSTNTDAKTTVDVTPPTTSDNASTEWQNSDVTVTLTCNDGVGSGCRETHYQICDENGDNCDTEQTGNSVSLTCSAGSVCKYTIKYYSIDNVGNTEETKTSGVIKIDKKPPETSATVGTPKYETDTTTYITSDTQITLEGSDGEIGSGVDATYYKIDGGSEQTYSESSPITISDEGPHTITYWSVDKVGNVENAKTLSVYVDNSGPTIGNIQIEPSYSDGANLYISGTSTISAPVNDGSGSGVASCEYTLNADDANPTWNSAEYDSENHLCKAENVDTSGATSINFRATDYVENTGTGTAVGVVVDKNAPSISISGNPNKWVNTDQTAQISCEDGNGESGCNSNTIGYKLYDSDPGTCPGDASEYTVGASVKISSHQWVCAYGEDNVGNSATAGPVEFKVDKIAPTISDDYEYDGIWVNSDQTVTLSPSDEGDSGIKEVKYCEGESCDVSQGTVLYSPYQLTFSDDGIKVIKYQTWDNAGNPSTVGTFTVKIDKTPPTVSVSGAPTSWTKETQTASVDCQDGLSGCNQASYKLYISGSQITSCPTDSNQYTSPDNSQISSHSWVCAYAEDNVGNYDFSDSPVEFKVDQVSPEVQLTGVPTDWQNTDATIELSCSDNGGSKCSDTMYYGLADSADACTPNEEYSTPVSVSSHQWFCYKVSDNAGNEVTGSKEIKVDKIEPTTEIASPDEGSWHNSDFEVSISDSDTGGSGLDKCYYRVLANNSGEWEYTTGGGYEWIERPCNSTIILTVGSDSLCKYEGKDACKLQVKAIDKAGNDNWKPSYISKSRTFSIDWTSPSVYINSPTQHQVIVGNTLSVQSSVSDKIDAELECYYQIDSGDMISIDCDGSDINVAGLSEGHHTLYVYAYDDAGNEGEASVDFIVNNDGILTVDDDKQQIQNPDFTSIQAAINAASEGDKIEVAPGTYDEQIIISKPLTIQGQGDTTIIKPSQTTADNFQLFSRKAGGSDNTAPIVVANADATIKNLKIDGAEISSVPSGATFVGILYRGVNGTIDSVTVENINISSGIGGNAIYISSMNKEVNVEVKGCTISNFYKNGITANYEGLTVNIHDNTIIGSGPRDDVAQNGIQIGYGATGSVVENIVSNIAYTGEDWEATGILFVDSSGIARDNIVTNCQVGIDAQAGWYPPVTCDVTIENNTIDASGLTSLSYIAGTGAVTWDENAAITVTIKNNDLTGAGYGEGVSIGSESEWAAGTVDATIEGNDISNWGHGIWLGPTSNQISIIYNNITSNVEVDSGIHITGVDVSGIKINFNNIEGNAAYGVYNGGSGILNATYNYWGSASGPTHSSNTYNVGSQGDKVSDNVDFAPWLDAPYPDGASFAPVKNTNTGEGFASIQAAVDDSDTQAGHVIEVVAGTYTENIVISKSVTLKGENRETTVIDGNNNGNTIEIKADNVVIEGFTIKNGNLYNVYMNDDGKSYNLKLKNNIIRDAAEYGAVLKQNDANADVEVVIENNIFEDNGNDNLYLEENPFVTAHRDDYVLSSSGYRWIVRNNTFNPCGPSGSLDYSGLGFEPAIAVLIEDNTFNTYWGVWTDNSRYITIKNNVFSYSLGNGGAGIVVWGDDPSTKDVEILNNVISGFTANNWQPEDGKGIVVGGAENVLIKNNTIENNTIGIWINDDYTNCKDNMISNSNAPSTTIKLNTIRNNQHGIIIEQNAENNHVINYNDFYGNSVEDTGLHNYATGEVNAEYNYWGCADGPGNAGCDSVSENVDYDPWLKASKDDAPVRENGQPTGYVNTDTLTLSLTTDRPATCRYSEEAGTEYDSMTEFTTTGGTSHSVDLSNLAEGEHTYYVKCKSNIDGEPVNSGDYEISFTVDLTSPQIVGRSPGINAVGVDATTNITIVFSEEVKCSLGSWENCISLDSVNGTVTYSNKTLIFDPKKPLDSNTEFTVNLTGITDLAGNSLEGITEWKFITATYYSINITSGWNLISIPVVPVNESIEAVLGAAKEKINAVWTYDAVNDEWYVYHPDNPETSNLDTMTAGYGYWISATGDATIEGYGSLFKEQQTPPQRILVPGWNLIGYYQKAGVKSIGVKYALSTLADDYCDITKRYWTSLVGYDNSAKTFVDVSWDDEMTPGSGYWIFMKSGSIETYMYGPGEGEENCSP